MDFASRRDRHTQAPPFTPAGSSPFLPPSARLARRLERLAPALGALAALPAVVALATLARERLAPRSAPEPASTPAFSSGDAPPNSSGRPNPSTAHRAPADDGEAPEALRIRALLAPHAPAQVRPLAFRGEDLLARGSLVPPERRVVGHSTPLAEELLPEPIPLEGCPGVRVVEWQGTPGLVETTAASPRAIAVLTASCRLVLARFPAFAREQGLPLVSGDVLSVSVSLLPAGAGIGEAYRGLNDLAYRFAHHGSRWNEDGSPVYVHGYFEHAPRHVYLRNDVLREDGSARPFFVVVLAHELYHALSNAHGFALRYAPDRHGDDEAMARRFTRWLGLGE